jgi:hypothetical protein
MIINILMPDLKRQKVNTSTVFFFCSKTIDC